MSAMPKFAREPEPGPASSPWRILVVDDDPEVLAVTRLALGDFSFEGQPLEILDAASGAEARALWERESGIALVLLDVVMETDHAGLDFVRFVRDEHGDDKVRIVLRTGQPGQAPALEVINQYEIDDYRTKTELTFQRLVVVVTTALRTYRLLEEMEARQRTLEQSNRELERFAYVTSYDLKSPLRTIVGSAQLLSMRYRDALDAQARDLIDCVAQNARDMDALIGNLLDYSRIGRAEAAIGRVDLNQVIEATRRRTQFAIEQRGAVLECGVLPSLEGNAALLEQLFGHLIDNAIKYQPGDKPYVAIEAQDCGPHWEIRVTDRGTGIDPRLRDFVFEPFRRLHVPEYTSSAGIGLAICKRIAEVHGGAIRLESEPGRGTCVIVTLPPTQPRRRTGGRV
jgi:signal transduction histidine kinase